MVAKQGTDLTFAYVICKRQSSICTMFCNWKGVYLYIDNHGRQLWKKNSELFKLDYHYFPGNSFVRTYFRSVRSLSMPFMVEWSFVGCQLNKIQLCIRQSSYSSTTVWIKSTAHQRNVNYFYINVYLHYILPVISERVNVFKPIQSCKLLFSIPNTLTL